MWINRIVLVNWRAYSHATFEMPRRGIRSNVVVIGAENEVGKTSLLEAVTLCLFGERGLSSLGRSMVGGKNVPLAYGSFLCGAFHNLADLSSPKSSVTLVFEMENGGEISVERVWHFGPNREFRGEDFFVQKDGKDITIPALADRHAILAGYITEHFLPPSLSPFFLFDAARVQEMARSDMKGQVRSGIEGILGIPIVRQLIGDLHDYATQRRNKGMSGRASDSKMEALQQNISKAEADAKRLAEESSILVAQLERTKAEERDLVLRYGEMGGDNAAGLSDLREKSVMLQNARKGLLDSLADFLVRDFAMSLVGPNMLTAAALRLRTEKSRIEWERDKKKGSENYIKFVGNLERLEALSLPLSEDLVSNLRKNLKTAWDDVWHPMPEECAKKIFNSGFSEDERAAAIERLEGLADFGIAEVKTLRENIMKNEADSNMVARKIAEVRGDHAEEIRRLHTHMTDKRDEVVALEKKKGDYEREKEGVDNELARMRQEMSREINQRKGSDPFLHCSERAGNAARMIESIIHKSYSHHVADIAREMTAAFKAMAHKGGSISKIQIEDDCDIKVWTPDGKNLRELVQSHGESEIFSLALIAAIAHVSGNQFPFIIDTPLANLDERHRHEFLRYFSSDMDNQIILLSTDTEIRGEHMDLIQHRVAHKFLIERERGGIGRSVVRPGRYFGEHEE